MSPATRMPSAELVTVWDSYLATSVGGVAGKADGGVLFPAGLPGPVGQLGEPAAILAPYFCSGSVIVV